MAPRKEALKRTFTGPAARRSLIVALLVGTILNAINQGDAILRGDPILWRLLLTYFVPFVVASYGSYAAFRNG